MSSTENAIENIFKYQKDFLLIGLTGRTGSGCSTSAQILSENGLNLPEASKSHFTGDDTRKFRIIKKYMSKNWKPFLWLRVTSIITGFILAKDFSVFSGYVRSKIDEKMWPSDSDLSDFHERFKEFSRKIKDVDIEKKDAINRDELYKLYFEEMPEFSKEMKIFLNNIEFGLYTKIYQFAGDNIRSSGSYDCPDFDTEKVLSFAEKITQVVLSAFSFKRNCGEGCRIVIDAIRNPYEALFLKKRFSSFYLVSVNTDNENRLKYLRGSHKLSDDQIKVLDKKEYPSGLRGNERFVSQNIQKCIEISDIHVNNPRSDNFGHSELRCQLSWYVSLMLHPGLVPPTLLESCMQVAYSVKKNSGCISRQVGAAVSDESYSIKSVGWNNPAEGQVPCILRSAEDLINGYDGSAYSFYEKNDSVFRDSIKNKYINVISDDSYKRHGLNLSFCFKDIQNEVEGEKNQVYTRSLHAEENAFLQISKNGGQSLSGGVLFTTASPCELCAKKAYQLGISKVVYIDPYPGIATSHILRVGSNAPELTLFRGVVGAAFDRLYQPIMPFKDELNLYFDIPKSKTNDQQEIDRLREQIEQLKKQISDMELEKQTASCLPDAVDIPLDSSAQTID